MLINRIGLKNFKCFQETDIKLAKITLLTGENSSGKSSLLYGLLFPFQSDGFPINLSPNGKYVTMGDFTEISFNNSTNNQIELAISINNKQGQEISYKTIWKFNPQTQMPSLYYLESKSRKFNLEIKQGNDTWLLNFNQFDNEKPHLETDNGGVSNNSISDLTQSADSLAISNIINDLTQVKAVEIKENIKNLQFESVNELLNKLLAKKGYISIRFEIEKFLILLNNLSKNLNFISSFRLQPERTYYQKNKLDYKILSDGTNYIDQILQWEYGNGTEFQTLKKTLKELDLLQSIKVKKLPSGRFEPRVQVKKKGIWASLTDVGFGISQLLPILVADLQLPNLSALLLAQPEIHLHPSVQAALATYFVKQVNKTNKQYIIETHSEYLLNRIRLAIVKGELNPTDVAVYYFENSVEGSITHPIDFTKDGQIKNAPSGFFDTYMIDTMDIALYA